MEKFRLSFIIAIFIAVFITANTTRSFADYNVAQGKQVNLLGAQYFVGGWADGIWANKNTIVDC